MDLDTTLTVVAGNLYRLLALKLPRYENAGQIRVLCALIVSAGMSSCVAIVGKC